MNDLRELAENQGGVIYIEQFEQWIESVVEQLEEEKEIAYADFDKYDTDYKLDLDDYYDDYYHIGLGRAIDILNRGGVKRE